MIGRKDDTSKLRWSLLPKGTISQVLEILEFGAQKYEPDNWQHVPNAKQRYYDALMRHVDAWWKGEKNDPESGKHHLAHAGCCVLFLLFLDGAEDSTELKFPPLEPDALNRGPWLKATHGSVRHEIDKAPFRWTHVLVELWDGERTACPLAQYQWSPDQRQFRMFREVPAK